MNDSAALTIPTIPTIQQARQKADVSNVNGFTIRAEGDLFTRSTIERDTRQSNEMTDFQDEGGVAKPTSQNRTVAPEEFVIEGVSHGPSSSYGSDSIPVAYSHSPSSHSLPQLHANILTSNSEIPQPSNATSKRHSTTSLSAENLHIQRTYQRISNIGGIPRDGFVDGMELTRERKSEASINGYLSQKMQQTNGVNRRNSGRAFSNLIVAETVSSPLSRSAPASQYTNYTNGIPSQPENTVSGALVPRHEQGQTLRTHSAAVSVPLEADEEEIADLKVLERVDRYGFFAPTYGKHARLVLLSRKAFMGYPAKNLKIQGISGKKTKKKKEAISDISSGEIASPYLVIDSRGSVGTSNSSRRSSRRPQNIDSLASSTSSHSMNDQGDFSATSTPMSARQKEASRIDKWYTEMLIPSSRDDGGNIATWKLASESEEKLRRRVMKGIPDRWRAAAWEALMTRAQLKSMGKGKGKVKGRIEDLNSSKRFYDLTLQPCDHDVQIDLDIPRTISGHLYFHTRYGLGQRSLFNTLHTFALLCPDCGYCQGMGSLAATILCYLPPERAYTAMVHLHDTYDLHSVFQPGFPGMLECFHVQEKLVEVLMPEVYAVFEKNFISSSSFATKWYITLFTNVLSFSSQLRIWDAFFLEGKDALIITSTAIIWALRNQFTNAKADFETILSMLSSFFVPEDEDILMNWIGTILYRGDIRAMMDGWKLDYGKQQT